MSNYKLRCPIHNTVLKATENDVEKIKIPGIGKREVPFFKCQKCNCYYFTYENINDTTHKLKDKKYKGLDVYCTKIKYSDTNKAKKITLKTQKCLNLRIPTKNTIG